jgi:hypothetical protein
MTNDPPSGWVPESCSLPTVERPVRVAEFDRLFTDAVLRSTRVSAIRLDLVLAVAAEATARNLAAREVGCCSFFSFEFVTAGPDVLMSIVVSPSQTEVLDALTRRVDKIIATRTAS